MLTTKCEICQLETEDDIVGVRQRLRLLMIEDKFSLIQQTKMVTATSELARNAIIHGGGGLATIERFANEEQIRLRVTFEDKGPGM
jgi:serine/threonine-protein kinase RsbT